MPSVLGTIRRNRWHYAYLFILPILVVFGLFRIYPSIQTLVYSFFDINLVAKTLKPVALKNFILLAHDATFLKAMKNTLIFALAIVSVAPRQSASSLPPCSPPACAARPFSRPCISRPSSRAPSRRPWSGRSCTTRASGSSTASWRSSACPRRSWISSSKDALASIIIFSIWKTVGYNMIIFIAGLQNIPDSFHEAAIIDGAGGIRRFFAISLPLVAPTAIFVVMYNTILALKVFDQVFVLTAGGPADATTVVVLQIYKQAFENYRFGYAASMAFVLFVIIISITVVQYRLSRRWEVTY